METTKDVDGLLDEIRKLLIHLRKEIVMKNQEIESLKGDISYWKNKCKETAGRSKI